MTALDVYAACRASPGERRSAPGAMRPDGSVRVEEGIVVNQPPDACYAMWRDEANLPRFMRNLDHVEPRGDGGSHWIARGPGDVRIEWDAEITRDEPNALLAWRALEGSELPNAGAVRFIPAPGARGTIVSVTLQYDPPAGRVGLTLATLLGESPAHDVRVEEVPDPRILNPRDCIVRITSTAICGSDLHLYDGYVPTMLAGDILGHEFMGEVAEVGPGVHNLKAGDRVVVPFPIACGHCFFCQREQYSLCENSNPNAGMAEKLWGHSPCGIFGYSHLTGGYAGGRRSTRGCRSPTPARAASRATLPTRRCCSCRTSCPPAGRRCAWRATGRARCATHVQRYMRRLLERIRKGEIDASLPITHERPLEAAPEGYRMFRDKQDDCIKVVLKPRHDGAGPLEMPAANHAEKHPQAH